MWIESLNEFVDYSVNGSYQRKEYDVFEECQYPQPGQFIAYLLALDRIGSSEGFES